MKHLILGDGRLATEISKQTNWDCISRTKNGFDFRVPDTYKKLLKGYNVIINCIACTNTILNEKDAHWDINYIGVIDLVDICNKENAKLIQISTDYIYANSVPNASEIDEQNLHKYNLCLFESI